MFSLADHIFLLFPVSLLLVFFIFYKFIINLFYFLTYLFIHSFYSCFLGIFFGSLSLSTAWVLAYPRLAEPPPTSCFGPLHSAHAHCARLLCPGASVRFLPSILWRPCLPRPSPVDNQSVRVCHRHCLASEPASVCLLGLFSSAK